MLLIHAGGTVIMRSGSTETLRPDAYTRDLLEELPILEPVLTKLMVTLGRAGDAGRVHAMHEAFATSLGGEMG